ncbi:T9SS type A sorting domain-containing protein [Xanthomarina sp. F2636L]|uniref:T9SS type A sorting domain-containing protein n=1 Tax=Xanthomarina sp. F2636L TaxID=2996018 RepID=UPI00225E0946|nr:T9SS type A sorting domain-containing protein [Xanthomarina sp. F2636L]MCX7551289.1 T9SS type A sorting domain-containing protein [Xanthomarina sp. F2636L]
MKKFILVLLFIPCLLFSQVQIGDDIDGEGAGDESGYSVSISSDGTIIAIGGRYNRISGGIFQAPGHVRIYENIGGIWTQIGQDLDGESSSDLSGSSVSTSSDGTIVAIGAPNNEGVNGFASGHVRIYEYNGTSWTQLGNDIDGERSGDRSGRRVSLSSDGTIVAISALGNNENGSNSGHVRVYEYNGTSWTQIGEDIDGESTYYQTGNSISLSNDGTRIAIETIGNNDNSGQISVYENQVGSWTQIGADIVREDTDEDSDGSVSLSGDGSILAIGVKYNDGNGINSGHVRVYEYNGTAWTQIGEDIDGEAVGDLSGNSVSLSNDGTLVSIGAYFNDGVNGTNSGHVRIYKNQGGSWIQIGDDIDGEASSDLSGFSVSLSNDGSIVAIGAIHNAGNGSDSGHVRVFDLTEALSIKENNSIDFNLYPNPAQNQVTIKLQEAIILEKVNIYNILGQLISTSKEKIINTTHLSPGMYLIEIETNQGKATKQLVIE